MFDTVCLAPRYLVKAFRSYFFPRDNDIVREMWVKGDLKRRLATNQQSVETLEANVDRAEMRPIRGYHDRSVSSTSRYETGYEPARTQHQGQYEMTPPVDNRWPRAEEWQRNPMTVQYAPYESAGAHPHYQTATSTRPYYSGSNARPF